MKKKSTMLPQALSFSKQTFARTLLLALAYLLVACGGGTTGTAPTLGPIAHDTPAALPTQPAPPTAAATPSDTLPPPDATQAGAANLLISYHKSGGIAGIEETLSVYANGTVEQRSKTSITKTQASPADIQALQALLASPEFAALQLPVQQPVPDQFIYELTLPGRAKPLVATDSADNPPVLRDLIAALEKLKTQAR